MNKQEKLGIMADLTIYIENTGMFYNNIIIPACKNLARKKYKGSYDDGKAKRAWYNVVNYGLQRYFVDVYKKYYADEYGHISAWHYLLTTQERKQIADELQAFYTEEINLLTDRLIKENEKPSFVGVLCSCDEATAADLIRTNCTEDLTNDFMNMRNYEPVADCDNALWDIITADDNAIFDDEGYEILK